MDEAPNLCSEARKRKDRLLALKRKAEEAGFQSKESQKLKLRSYVPNDENIMDNVLPRAKPSDVEAEVKDQLENISEPIIQELNINVLASNKSDFDLKRNIQKKLDKLEKITNQKIAEIIRDKLKSNQSDLEQ